MKLRWIHKAAAKALEWALVNFLKILQLTANFEKFARLLNFSEREAIIWNDFR